MDKAEWLAGLTVGDLTAAEELLRYFDVNAPMLIRAPIEVLVNKVIYGETERCANKLLRFANEHALPSHDQLVELCAELRCTSPGKGGG